jgi:hypothetical protein
MTLDEFINGGSQWPAGCMGLRTKRGHVVWTTAHYPDGCSGNLVCLSRIVHENGETFSRTAYYDRDTEIVFVPRVAQIVQIEQPLGD